MRTATVTRLYTIADALIVVREFRESLDAMGDRDLLGELTHPFIEDLFFVASPRVLSMDKDKATETMSALIGYLGLPLPLA